MPGRAIGTPVPRRRRSRASPPRQAIADGPHTFIQTLDLLPKISELTFGLLDLLRSGLALFRSSSTPPHCSITPPHHPSPSTTAATMSTVTRRKLVIVGDGACGKTCLLIVFSKGTFPEVRIPSFPLPLSSAPFLPADPSVVLGLPSGLRPDRV